MRLEPSGIIWPEHFNLKNAETLRSSLVGESIAITFSSVVHHQKCLDKYGYWSDSLLYGADQELWRRIIGGGDGRNFAFVSEPTLLKFRAAWDKPKQWWQLWEYHEILRRLKLLDSILPPEFRLSLPAGVTEQESLWRIMNEDIGGWTDSFRQATVQFLDARLSAIDGLAPLMASRIGRGLFRLLGVRRLRRYQLVKSRRWLTPDKS